MRRSLWQRDQEDVMLLLPLFLLLVMWIWRVWRMLRIAMKKTGVQLPLHVVWRLGMAMRRTRVAARGGVRQEVKSSVKKSGSEGLGRKLEFERKQAAKAEKKREKEDSQRRHQGEIKQRKENEKARKAAAKKAAADRRKDAQEVGRFTGKDALKEMVAFVDPKVVEKGLIGGQLLSRFGQKNVTVKVEQNPLENSITWRTKCPSLESLDRPEIEIGSQDEVTGSQVVYDEVDIQYLDFVFEAEEFSTMVAGSSLFSHVQKAQLLYPGYTICYVVNKLTAFLKKKDQDKYQAPHAPANIGWHRPPVEKALAGLLTNFTGVHSRLCVDEAEVADHMIGLTASLADSYYRPKLSKFSLCKNGDHVRHDDAFREEIREDQWLKALVAIPKVSGPCAVSIGRVYPTMRSLLMVYLDKEKTQMICISQLCCI